MTFVKICGITNREDANLAVDLGADALGFIGIAESQRYVSAHDFMRIRDVLPPNFPAVVVVKRAADSLKYHSDYVQYYEESELPHGLSAETTRLRTFRIHVQDDLEAAGAYTKDHAVVLDAFHCSFLGGTGTRFDWEMLQGLRDKFARPLILAGGLTHKNVADAIKMTMPVGVDVSSGVEEPKIVGKKNPELLRWFITAVREWDMRNGTASPDGHFPG